jgi:hypothetical protein
LRVGELFVAVECACAAPRRAETQTFSKRFVRYIRGASLQLHKKSIGCRSCAIFFAHALRFPKF